LLHFFPKFEIFYLLALLTGDALALLLGHLLGDGLALLLWHLLGNLSGDVLALLWSMLYTFNSSSLMKGQKSFYSLGSIS
jgi:hypothetical protein